MSAKRYVEFNSKNVPIKAWTSKVAIEESAIEQLQRLASLPFIYKHLAVMPDVHIGKGATVGSVIPTIDAIIPSAVGGDIGCGMNAIKLSLFAKDLPDNLYRLRRAIEKKVPVGKEQHKKSAHTTKNNTKTFGTLEGGLKELRTRHPSLDKMDKNLTSKSILQMGTLGSGNHFIEICLDQNEQVWIMLHSGSRGVGNKIGQYFMDLAKKDMRRHQINLPDEDLAYLKEGTQYFDDYLLAMDWAQEYARLNRKRMMEIVLWSLTRELPPFEVVDEAVNCHHNYISMEEHFGQNIYVTRKGTVRAGLGELGIIPGSMGAKSFIVKGKGNKDSFCSCSHGAGRLMSRAKAKKLYNQKDHEEATKDVECRKDFGVIDETPKAYKNIEDVMASQDDLVEVLYTLKQIVCVKG